MDSRHTSRVSAYHALRADLHAGRWQPGERLPTQARLAHELGVTREDVSRAMRRLAVEDNVVKRAAGYHAAAAGLAATPTYLELACIIALRICAAGHVPGTPLPSTPQIAAEFGVSGTCVCRALAVLIDAHLAYRRVRGRPAVVGCPGGTEHRHDGGCTPAARLEDAASAFADLGPEHAEVAGLLLMVVGSAVDRKRRNAAIRAWKRVRNRDLRISEHHAARVLDAVRLALSRPAPQAALLIQDAAGHIDVALQSCNTPTGRSQRTSETERTFPDRLRDALLGAARAPLDWSPEIISLDLLLDFERWVATAPGPRWQDAWRSAAIARSLLSLARELSDTQRAVAMAPVQPGAEGSPGWPAFPPDLELTFVLALQLVSTHALPDAPLPALGALADELGTSTVTLEKILKKLEAADLVLRRGARRPAVVGCERAYDHQHQPTCAPAARWARATSAVADQLSPELRPLAGLLLLVGGPDVDQRWLAAAVAVWRRARDSNLPPLSAQAASDILAAVRGQPRRPRRTADDIAAVMTAARPARIGAAAALPGQAARLARNGARMWEESLARLDARAERPPAPAPAPSVEWLRRTLDHALTTITPLDLLDLEHARATSSDPRLSRAWTCAAVGYGWLTLAQHAAHREARQLRYGPLVVDVRASRASLRGVDLQLRSKLLDALALLAATPGITVPYAAFAIPNPSTSFAELRRRLDDGRPDGLIVKAEYGVGYVLLRRGDHGLVRIP